MSKLRINFYLIFLFVLTFNLILVKKSVSQILDITTPAKQVMIYDHEADEVLFEKNADELMKPASMAKVMTAYIVFDKLKDKSLQMSDTFLVSNKAWRMGGLKGKRMEPV
jgi:D-alanyl-D-alanine carboxypeptidase (penicillin-binding protein 5/6)